MKGCRALNENEVKQIIENMVDAKGRLLALTGLYFGTRISEALALNFDDVSGSMLSLKSAKGSNNQTFQITAAYKQALAEAKEQYHAKGWAVNGDTALFLSQSGVRMSQQAASYIVKTAAKKANLEGKINNHSFRKCFVTKIYSLTGCDIAQTKQYSRHKSLANLDYYISTAQGTELVNNLNW